MESAIAHSGEGQWLVELEARPEAAAALRDYFMRLGISARIAAPALVELTGDEDEATLREYTQSWASTNGIAADLRPGKPAAPSSARAVGGLPAPPPRLGEVLRRKGLISEEQLDAGLAEAHRTGELLGVVLLRKRVIFEDELARTLSEQLAIPYVSIGRVGVDVAAARMLPQSVGLQVAAIPVRLKDDGVQVAFADPTDSVAIDRVRAYVPKISLAVAELSDIRGAWRGVPRAG